MAEIAADKLVPGNGFVPPFTEYRARWIGCDVDGKMADGSESPATPEAWAEFVLAKGAMPPEHTEDGTGAADEDASPAQ